MGSPAVYFIHDSGDLTLSWRQRLRALFKGKARAPVYREDWSAYAKQIDFDERGMVVTFFELPRLPIETRPEGAAVTAANPAYTALARIRTEDGDRIKRSRQ